VKAALAASSRLSVAIKPTDFSRWWLRTDLASNAKMTASNSRGNFSEFSPANLVDGCETAYWATDDSIRTGWVEFEFPQPTRINHIILMETISLGQRIRKWHLEIFDGQTWRTVCNGTTVGHKRIVPFATESAHRLRLVIDESKASPVLTSVSFYNVPPVLDDPLIHRDLDGNVTIHAGENIKVRYTLDGWMPDLDSAIYETPISLPNGGIVRASVFSQDNPGSLMLAASSSVERRFGLAKAGWKIISVDDEDPNCPAKNVIDDNDKTFWHTDYQTRKPNHPHTVDIDLGREVEVAALGYLPRQDGIPSGVVDRAEFYLTTTLSEWGTPVFSGRFDNIAANPIEQIVSLAKSIRVRYVRFVTLSTATHDPWAAVSGINVYGKI
jgi:alpha-L-fucosidase